MKQVKEEEILLKGIHKFKQVEVGLVKTTFDDDTVEYLTRDLSSNECFTGKTNSEFCAKGQFYQVAYSMSYWEKVKDRPNQDWEHQKWVCSEWDNK